MNRSEAVDLTVIMVNYNVAPLVLQAVASLARQRFAAPDGQDGRLEILVVDNASSPADRTCLQHLPAHVVQILNPQNRGFGQANNQAIRQAAGRYLCFLNPDTVVLDGALDALLRHLYQHPEAGAVGPRIWIDADRQWQLPPGDPPNLSFFVQRILAECSRRVGERMSRTWHRRALHCWSSGTPVPVSMLSGACLMTSRHILETVGGFDPGYFLYYEDTDWCRRVSQAGYQLHQVPGAEIVHYYNQSAKSTSGVAQRYARQSQAHFVRSHYGVAGTAICALARAAAGWLARHRRRASGVHVIDLGRCRTPPRFSVRDGRASYPFLTQIGYDPLFVPSAAGFLHGCEFYLSSGFWERLEPRRYYTRVIELDTLTPLGIWTWEKA
ncbi:MAG: glycosyltransferase family 2 protein [Candidatus Methylomirabilis oxyfera]|nr:glycosyltransferase family 2 protein [Candidatus Methylomirabilis oxyfera]